jgi:cell pole-organizing protein PopZ
MFSFRSLSRSGRSAEKEAAPENASKQIATPGDDEALGANGGDEGPVSESDAAKLNTGDEECRAMSQSVNQGQDKQSTEVQPTNSDGLLSKETEKAASASLSALLTASRKPQASAAGGDVISGRALEDVVRDALSPHLREWLDTNLPPLIEGEVRREVRRLTKEVEQALD